MSRLLIAILALAAAEARAIDSVKGVCADEIPGNCPDSRDSSPRAERETDEEREARLEQQRRELERAISEAKEDFNRSNRDQARLDQRGRERAVRRRAFAEHVDGAASRNAAPSSL